MDESPVAMNGLSIAFLVLAVIASWATPSAVSSQDPRASQPLFAGNSLDGWQVVNVLFFDRHGDVRINDGRIILDAGNPGTGIVWKGKVPAEPYELRIEAARLAGNDFFCGVTFPVGESFCTFIAGGWGGGVTGLSNINGLSAVENETTGYHPFKSNTWYEFRICVLPDKIKVLLDNQTIVDVERAGKKFSIWFEQEPLRPLGIASWQTKTAIRRVELIDLRAKQQLVVGRPRCTRHGHRRGTCPHDP